MEEDFKRFDLGELVKEFVSTLSINLKNIRVVAQIEKKGADVVEKFFSVKYFLAHKNEELDRYLVLDKYVQGFKIEHGDKEDTPESIVRKNLEYVMQKIIEKKKDASLEIKSKEYRVILKSLS